MISDCPSSSGVYTIGIAGGSGAGKSTLACQLYDALGGSQNVTYLVHDSYYRDQSHKSMDERSQTNFDHPDALETELMVHHIRLLKAGRSVAVPAYDFATHTRWPETTAAVLAEPRPILLVEGILILCHPELVKEMDLKVFVVRCILLLSLLCRPNALLTHMSVLNTQSTVCACALGCRSGHSLDSTHGSRLRRTRSNRRASLGTVSSNRPSHAQSVRGTVQAGRRSHCPLHVGCCTQQ
jgi:ABC-type oligopeptide transport system ATPase subunit